jgi:hypothetical protein
MRLRGYAQLVRNRRAGENNNTAVDNTIRRTRQEKTGFQRFGRFTKATRFASWVIDFPNHLICGLVFLAEAG